MVDVADYKREDGTYDMEAFTRAATIENVQKIVKPSLTVDQKVQCIDLAPRPEEFSKSDWLGAKRIMKAMVRGIQGMDTKGYEEPVACLWAMLVSVEKDIQEGAA